MKTLLLEMDPQISLAQIYGLGKVGVGYLAVVLGGASPRRQPGVPVARPAITLCCLLASSVRIIEEEVYLKMSPNQVIMPFYP